MINSVDFAKLIIKRANDKDIDLGETKLHKLLYICDGYMLALGLNVIDERAKAWNYGPVYPKVRKWLAANASVFHIVPDLSNSVQEAIQKINAVPLVDLVLKTYGNWSAAALSLWTHKPGSPWESALAKSGGVMNSPISKDDMRTYFKCFLKDEKNTR